MRAHASSVAPVVLTSSTTTTVAPDTGARLASAKAPRTFACRRAAGRSVCDGVARTRRSACATGTPRCFASSAAWLNPRARFRDRWRGTGTTRSASCRIPAPEVASIRPSGRAIWRRPSYFKACTIARSDPSYGPIARPRVTNPSRRRQRGHRACSMLVRRQEGSGSPHRSHTGGVMGTIAAQHSAHTGPAVGASSGRSHAAHAGASRTDSRPSATRRATSSPFTFHSFATHRSPYRLRFSQSALRLMPRILAASPWLSFVRRSVISMYRRSSSSSVGGPMASAA